MLSSTAYISEQCQTFNTIEFTGGTLNKLYHPNVIAIEWNKEKKQVILNGDDSQQFDVNTADINLKVKIHSSLKFHTGTYGHSISNEDIVVSFSFDNQQPFSSIFRHYDYLMNCLSFMTNRSNVGVEKIIVYSDDEEKHQSCFYAYMRNDLELTTKQMINCITFNDIGSSFATMLKMLYESTNESPNFSLSCIPENDKKKGQVTSFLIRSVCSALEFEAGKDKRISNSPEIKEIRSVARTVKNYLKRHRSLHASNPLLSEKTYNSIFSSVAHWDLSAYDRLTQLYHLYEKPMGNICSLYSLPEDEIDTHISEFVKYRNLITHDAERTISIDIAKTTIVLRGLVYCCVLNRIGISNDDILKLSSIKINN